VTGLPRGRSFDAIFRHVREPLHETPIR
jgi:hypothetical protein